MKLNSLLILSLAFIAPILNAAEPTETQTYYFDQTGCRDADIENLLKEWEEA